MPRPAVQSESFAASEGMRLVVFRLDVHRYALPLHAIERVVHAVAVTPVSDSPMVVLGVIDFEGRLVPVFNLRRRFGLPEQRLSPADHFVIAASAYGTVALVTDAVEGVIDHWVLQRNVAEPWLDDSDPIDGIVRCEDGLVLIQNLNRFLSAQEAVELHAALER